MTLATGLKDLGSKYKEQIMTGNLLSKFKDVLEVQKGMKFNREAVNEIYELISHLVEEGKSREQACYEAVKNVESVKVSEQAITQEMEGYKSRMESAQIALQQSEKTLALLKTEGSQQAAESEIFMLSQIEKS